MIIDVFPGEKKEKEADNLSKDLLNESIEMMIAIHRRKRSSQSSEEGAAAPAEQQEQEEPAAKLPALDAHLQKDVLERPGEPTPASPKQSLEVSDSQTVFLLRGNISALRSVPFDIVS